MKIVFFKMKKLDRERRFQYPNVTFDSSVEITSFTDPESGEVIDDSRKIEAFMNTPVNF
jgi:hypothetical protein